MTKSITLYHNPRCSKSRQALALLQAQGVEPRIVRYLEEPLNAATLREILQKLQLSARELLRGNERIARERSLHRPELSEEELIAAMIEEPRLIQRPIAVCGHQAILGRPPEQVLKLL